MSQDWERNVSSIVRETESNLARVRERLEGSEYRSFTSGLTAHNTGNGAMKYSTPSKPLHRSNIYDPYQPTGYHDTITHNAWQEDQGGISDHTPHLVAMLSEKIDTQNKVIQDLASQVKSLEREREQTTSRLRNMESAMTAISKRLEESGVHLETERKMERAQQDLRMQLSEVQNVVRMQRQSGATDGAYNDDVLTSVTRELHEFKRQTHEECDSIQREVESLRTRMVKTEVEVSGQQADTRDFNRRIDRLDRTVTSISDSQRVQCKDINQSMRQKQSTDRELDQLRTSMGRLFRTVDGLEHDSATTRTQPNSRLMTAGEAASIVHSTQPMLHSTQLKTEPKSRRKLHKKDRTRSKPRPYTSGVFTLDSSSEDDTNNFDISTTLSLDSSDSSDNDIGTRQPIGNLFQNSNNSGIPGEDVNELLSDLDDNFDGKDEALDIADLTDTLSISSVELDSDLF